MRLGTRRGATTIEMTLVGIPLIFILISIFEISRGVWMYHTLAYAAKNGIRYSIVHGINCVTTTGVPNTCTTNIAAVAAKIRQASAGADPALTMLTFTPGDTGPARSCYLAASTTSPYGSLSACSSYSGAWPPSGYNAVGQPIEIDIKTPFYSALAMFWPGSKPVRFALVNFWASSHDYVQF